MIKVKNICFSICLHFMNVYYMYMWLLIFLTKYKSCISLYL